MPRTDQTVWHLLLRDDGDTILPPHGDRSEPVAVRCLECILNLIQTTLRREDGDMMVVLGVPARHGLAVKEGADGSREWKEGGRGQAMHAWV